MVEREKKEHSDTQGSQQFGKLFIPKDNTLLVKCHGLTVLISTEDDFNACGWEWDSPNIV